MVDGSSDRASECSDRIEFAAISEFATSEEAIQALYSTGCTVVVTFDLLANGRVESPKAEASEPQCVDYEARAIEALDRSRFGPGIALENCRLVYSYFIEDDPV